MTSLIILKGKRNSGKSSSLRYLPLLLNSVEGKRALRYNDLTIKIIIRSIHESENWEIVIDKIIESGDYDVFVIAAWCDDIINESAFINKKVEDVISEKGGDWFDYFEVSTKHIEDGDKEKMKADNKRCANEIKNIIDKIKKPVLQN